MRSEQEMYDIILNFAKQDERIRAVILNGSRANLKVEKDEYQDFDIVFVVRNFEQFVSCKAWLDVFSERLIMQMPEAMRNPSGEGHFNYLMLFTDFNRIDLTLIPIEKMHLIKKDSLSIVLLDKEGILEPFLPPNDSDYITCKPSSLFYYSCCNNFFWCMQNVAKSIARDQLPSAMMMYHSVVREDLHDMISWYIGSNNNFSVSCGKMGMYFKQYLPPDIYQMYANTYSDASYSNLFKAVFTACQLFRELAICVAKHCGYTYNRKDDDGIMQYLLAIKDRHL